MLVKNSKIGDVIYYVVDDFDGSGIFKVKVIDVAGNSLCCIGQESYMNGVSLILSKDDGNIFNSYSEAKKYLNRW